MKNIVLKKVKSIFSIPLILSCSLCLLFTNPAIAFDNAKAASSSIDSTNLVVDKKDPYLMIEKVAGKTFKRFAQEQQAIQADPNIIKNIVREELMPYVNYKYSAFKVIGKHLKNTTAQERKDFVPVF